MTLLELAVAVLVLSIGTLAAVRGTDQARLEIGGAAPDRAWPGSSRTTAPPSCAFMARSTRCPNRSKWPGGALP